MISSEILGIHISRRNIQILHGGLLFYTHFKLFFFFFTDLSVWNGRMVQKTNAVRGICKNVHAVENMVFYSKMILKNTHNL